MAVVRLNQAEGEVKKPRPKARRSSRRHRKPQQAPNPETIDRPWTVLIVTSDHSDREGCRFQSFKNGLLGAPPLDARDKRAIDQKFNFRWIASLEDAERASSERGVVLIVLDLSPLGYSGRAQLQNAVRKAFKQFGLSRVVAMTLDPSAPEAKLKYKAVFDRRDRNCDERVAEMFCEFFPEASERFAAYGR